MDDGSTIILLNCSFKGEHPLKQLIEDLNESSAHKMNYKEISEAVENAKVFNKEDEGMKDLFEDLYEEAARLGRERGMEEGLKEGIQESRLETAKKMLSSGKISIDDIAEYTSLSVETIKKLAV